MKVALAVFAAGLALLGVDAALVARAAGAGEEPAVRGSLADAEAAVSAFVAAARALQDSDGDPRVAERVPASSELVAELSADLSYARTHLRVRERRDLMSLERTGSRWLPGGLAEVRTRELWIFRRLLPSGEDARPPRSSVWNVRYELARERGSWRVLDYRLEGPASAAASRSP